MGEGKGLRLYVLIGAIKYVLIGAIMFGLFIGARVIFGPGLMTYEEGFLLIGAIMFGLFTGATVIFLISLWVFVGWLIDTVKGRETNEGIVEEDPNPKPNPNCVLATDEDFSGTTNGSFKYIGSADCVKIPQVIKGEEVTSYRDMFRYTKVSKVISDNPNVTNMKGMFRGSQATELDLSNFNTSNVTDMTGMFRNSKATELDLSNLDTRNVTDMSWMFLDSQATELDLSNFDTSNVTSMSSMFNGTKATELDLSSFNTSKVTDMSTMFYSSQATVLDLSSFDTSNVTDMEGMFLESQAKTVYARTQADADKYNVSSYKPDGLQAVVKQ